MPITHFFFRLLRFFQMSNDGSHAIDDLFHPLIRGCQRDIRSHGGEKAFAVARWMHFGIAFLWACELWHGHNQMILAAVNFVRSTLHFSRVELSAFILTLHLYALVGRHGQQHGTKNVENKPAEPSGHLSFRISVIHSQNGASHDKGHGHLHQNSNGILAYQWRHLGRSRHIFCKHHHEYSQSQ